MAHAQQFPQDFAAAFAAQLAHSLEQGILGLAIHDAGKIELTETFAVWMIGLDDLLSGPDNLSELAIETGRWHHQLNVDGDAGVFARSKAHGGNPSGRRITEVFRSQLAEKIDASVTWIDENLRGDPLVRLLTIPAYHLTAFWLVEERRDSVMIVDVPAYYSMLESGFDVLAAETFLDTVRRGSPAEGRSE